MDKKNYIEDKYGIVYIDEKRYYNFKINTMYPSLEHTLPYLFKYKDIVIKEKSWKNLTVSLLNILDELNPKDPEELLALSYKWSKEKPFTLEKNSNHVFFKNIYFNVNHNATHAFMNIKFILDLYEIDYDECELLIRRHFSSEALEVREYFEAKTVEGFSNYLRYIGYEEKRILTNIRNFYLINKILKKMGNSYDNFLIFDDYDLFESCKSDVIKYLKDRSFISDKNKKNYNIVNRELILLGDYYKNGIYYKYILDDNFRNCITPILEKEIAFLFKKLDIKAISSGKLYSRMKIMHKKEMSEFTILQSEKALFAIAKLLFIKKYKITDTLILELNDPSNNNYETIVNYVKSLNEIRIDKLNDAIDNAHMKKPSSYFDMIYSLRETYLQVDAGVLVKKTIANISEKDLNTIENELKFYINSFGNIDSENYKGYNSLPNIGYEWNKYLLSGLIQTYFDDEFILNYEVNKYNGSKYKIELA